MNGTLIPTTPVTRSGCSSACCHTTIEPQSWPTNTARSGADVVEQAEEVVGEVGDVVVVDRLGPARAAVAALVRREDAVARRSASAGIWWRHE